MVRGIDGFRAWFKGYEDQYTIIGGTACDLLMENAGLDFRATKDIDLVLIVEMLDDNFVKKLLEYIKEAGYEHKRKGGKEQQFYRFSKPKSNEYPYMIELFSRNTKAVKLPEDATLTPLPIDEDVSSLSAILLNDDYYEFLKNGKVQLNGITILDAPFIIPFKAKAWLDLSSRKETGEAIDEKNIRKHKNDVFRLYELLNINNPISPKFITNSIKEDMKMFIFKMEVEDVDLKQLNIISVTKEEILNNLKIFYSLLSQ